MTDEPKREFWWCCIGPVDRHQLPFGCDSPPRVAAIEAVEQMYAGAFECASGWGYEESFHARIARLAAENKRLSEANESAAVCRKHLKEFMGLGCLVCENKRLRELLRLLGELDGLLLFNGQPIDAPAMARAALRGEEDNDG